MDIAFYFPIYWVVYINDGPVISSKRSLNWWFIWFSPIRLNEDWSLSSIINEGASMSAVSVFDEVLASVYCFSKTILLIVSLSYWQTAFYFVVLEEQFWVNISLRSYISLWLLVEQNIWSSRWTSSCSISLSPSKRF